LGREPLYLSKKPGILAQKMKRPFLRRGFLKNDEWMEVDLEPQIIWSHCPWDTLEYNH
jgi:hypothetical protein